MRFATLLGTIVCAAAWAQPADRTTLQDAPNFTATRSGKYLVVELKKPHLVLSTSGGKAGGQAEGIRFLVNHQSSEANGEMNARTANMTRSEFHDDVARTLNIQPSQMAMMGTAANMNNLGRRHVEVNGVTVDAFVTAGVEGNAARPDDPADWLETEDGYVNVSANKGTINTILIFNKALTTGAQARAAVTMVEAKAAALTELAIPSLYSTHIATGSGTDQFIVASPSDPGAKPLEWPASSSKLGQMIGQAVKEATLEALRWQNGLEPSATRDLFHAMRRFGLNDAELRTRLQALLPEASYASFAKSPGAITKDPGVAAPVYAYAAVLDRLQYGTIPQELAAESLRNQAALVAAALASQPERVAEFRAKIQSEPGDRLGPLAQGLAAGWQVRWDEPAEDPVAKGYLHEVDLVEHDVLSLAQAMPADKYSFAPSQGAFQGVRTFADQVKHLAAMIYMTSAIVLGEPSPFGPGVGDNGPAEIRSKEQILEFLQGSFAYARKAMRSLTAANHLEPVRTYFGPMTRAAVASGVTYHSFDHYGQMVVYARMNGIVPPSSQPAGAP